MSRIVLLVYSETCLSEATPAAVKWFSQREACLAGRRANKNSRPRGLVHLLGSLSSEAIPALVDAGHAIGGFVWRWHSGSARSSWSTRGMPLVDSCGDGTLTVQGPALFPAALKPSGNQRESKQKQSKHKLGAPDTGPGAPDPGPCITEPWPWSPDPVLCNREPGYGTVPLAQGSPSQTQCRGP